MLDSIRSIIPSFSIGTLAPPSSHALSSSRATRFFNNTPSPSSLSPTLQAPQPSFFEKLWSGVVNYPERIKSAGWEIFDGVRDTIRGAGLSIFHGSSSIVSGIKDIASGEFLAGLKGIGKGLIQTILQTPADAIILGLGKPFFALNTLLGLSKPSEKLTPNQNSIIDTVFQSGIDSSRMRIAEFPPWLHSITGSVPFTLGNTVLTPPEQALSANDLVHEGVHVWQNQTSGSSYISESLFSQGMGSLFGSSRNDAYQFGHALYSGSTWNELNPEQQARLIDYAFEHGFFSGSFDGLLADKAGAVYTTTRDEARFYELDTDGSLRDVTPILDESIYSIRKT